MLTYTTRDNKNGFSYRDSALDTRKPGSLDSGQSFCPPPVKLPKQAIAVASPAVSFFKIYHFIADHTIVAVDEGGAPRRFVSAVAVLANILERSLMLPPITTIPALRTQVCLVVSEMTDKATTGANRGLVDGADFVSHRTHPSVWFRDS